MQHVQFVISGHEMAVGYAGNVIDVTIQLSAI